MGHQVAIVMTEVFLRRLTPALTPFVRHQHDFRIVSIHRPIKELRALLEELRPSALITEWLPKITDDLLELEIPTVIADTDFNYASPKVTSIDVNDWQVGAEAARAFAQAGYRNFACLGNDTPYSDQRIEGFKSELGDRTEIFVHRESSFSEARYSEDFGQIGEGLSAWLESLPKPVGIFAVHDPLGRFLCGACRQIGLKVPEEVAVIGANNDELVCGLSYPMLSSVAIPWHTIGEAVGEALQGLLAGEKSPSKPILVSPSGVVLRHSANHLAVEDPMLRRAMTFLSERIQDPITIEILCHELSISRRGLERKFREYFQCSPWEMLCQLRVKRAKHLLTETKHPISIISELSGFNDPERMAVVFKRVEGMAPSVFRKGMK